MTKETPGQSHSTSCLSVVEGGVKGQEVEEDNERNSAGHFVSFLIFKRGFSDVSSSTFTCCCFPQRRFSLWRVSEVRSADMSSHRHKGHAEKITNNNNNSVCCSLRGRTHSCSFYKYFICSCF